MNFKFLSFAVKVNQDFRIILKRIENQWNDIDDNISNFIESLPLNVKRVMISVWSWNFKDGGSLKSKIFGQESTYSRDFFFKFVHELQFIFNIKNQLIFFKRNLGLGQIYWPKD